MTFSSSPVLYPPSSSPPMLVKKRKLFQAFPSDQHVKKSRTAMECLQAVAEGMAENERVMQEPVHAATVSLPQRRTEFVGSVQTTDNDDVLDADGTRSGCPGLPSLGRPLLRKLAPKTIDLQTVSGTTVQIPVRTKSKALSYEETIAQRSTTATGRAKKAYYGIDIHKLMDEAKIQQELASAQTEFDQQAKHIPSIEAKIDVSVKESSKSGLHQMWTEKYRAKKFTELVGDERTHRSVLRWLKAWDDVVFHKNSKPRARKIFEDKTADQEQKHRKILLLTGPPGLGKTTLAHVCARQAGYEVLEINASDDRSRDVVKGRIKDVLGTETVRGVKEQGHVRRAGRPVCVIVDEVDGVTTGSASSGGEGGFMKALLDLVQLDLRNSSNTGKSTSGNEKKRNGDKFRMLRPLILICNDVYAPSLRPLRTSAMAEVVHVRKPALDKVMVRLKTVFEKENIPCDNDAVRRLCENAWGLGTRKQNSHGSRGAGEGDIRGILVQAEWMAHKLRSAHDGLTATRLTRKWIESHLSGSQSGGAQKGLGREGTREVVDRIFIEGAGLPNLPTSLSADDARMVAESKTNPVGVADLRKRAAISALREMVDTCGDHDRLMTDCFATYPTRVFQDDVKLTKPNACYDWLHFHDALSSRIFSGQEWELNPYLNTATCGFHHLFAAVEKGSQGWNHDQHNKDDEEPDAHPFRGAKADFAAYEAEKENRMILTELQSSFSAPLLRLFPSLDNMATDLVPNVSKMLAPEIKPVVVGGSGGSASVASVRKESEKNCVKTAVRVMSALNVSFEKVKIEVETGSAHSHGGGFVYRMEPPLDTLSMFHMDKPVVSSTTNNSSASTTTATNTSQAPAPVRYAVRQVLDQEYRKELILQNSVARYARSSYLDGSSQPYQEGDEDKENLQHHSKNKQTHNNKPPAAAAAIGLLGAKQPPVKRDFFGRIVVNSSSTQQTQPYETSSISDGNPLHESKHNGGHRRGKSGVTGAGEVMTSGERVWVSFHEGFSNAVRKPITLKEFLDSF